MTRLRSLRALTALVGLLVAAGAPLTGLRAQDRDFCDPAMDMCSDDRFEVVFPVGPAIDDSLFEYAEFVAGTVIESGVVMNAVSARVQGWSYAVKHDPAILDLDPTSVTIDGTETARLFSNGFNTTLAVLPGPPPNDPRTCDGVCQGFVQAVVLSFVDDIVLPTGRSLIAKANYRLTADAGPDGTLVQIVSDELTSNPNSPPTSVNITVDGMAFLPRVVRDGVVRRADGGRKVEGQCADGIDNDGDGLIDMDDPDCFDCQCLPGQCQPFAFYFGDNTVIPEVDARGMASFVVSSRNNRGILSFQFGVTTRPDGDAVRYAFSGELGTDNQRLVELLMTDAANPFMEILPTTPNTLIADTAGVSGIERGAALAGFEPGDFLEFDLEPGVGGPGFFVGYVSDLDDNVAQIPLTPPGDGMRCPLNELLRVNLGPVECPAFAIYFGDRAIPGTVDVQGQARFPISSRNTSIIDAFQFGVRTTQQPGGGGVIYEFVDDLGIDDDRLVEVIFAEVPNTIVPVRPNQLRASTSAITNIRRGSAIAAFDPGDFLQFDFQPGVGGPGFFVGYVSDLDNNVNRIPATPPQAPGGECLLNELLVVDLQTGGIDCRDFGYYFGSEALAGVIDATQRTRFAISSRNAAPLFAFSLGVTIRSSGAAFAYEFNGDLRGTPNNPPVELLMTIPQGNTVASVVAAAVNSLRSVSGTVAVIEKGSALTPIMEGDFLEIDLQPEVGGPGFIVGYVADLDDNVNFVPATPPQGGDGSCALNELLIVRLPGDLNQRFFRGDGDGNGRINVSDAVVIIQVAAMNIEKVYDCDDALDADNDEVITVVDALPVLAHIFQRGGPLMDPFGMCGDDTPGNAPEDLLGCAALSEFCRRP
ncbi:MAG: hypothetical protein O7J95_03490 [Planctomycetota bacterium]|nr:hypothetical protein [Planctomycetota bacterium]